MWRQRRRWRLLVRLIWRFEPERRPRMLFYGGWMPSVGRSWFQVMAGFALTGLAVVLTSLETARQHVCIVSAHVDRTLSHASFKGQSHQFTFNRN
ncbi:MAG: hypothetical protein R2911_05200 [Caldilineaceae bacterium]